MWEEKYNHENADAFVGEAQKEQSSSHTGGCEKMIARAWKDHSQFEKPSGVQGGVLGRPLASL